MNTGTGRINETSTGERGARIACAANLIPAPGQYLLAWAESDSAAPLPVPVFSAGYAAEGFYAAAPLPVAWKPGDSLQLRGPLGHGFHLPPGARRVGLAAFGATSARLLALLPLASAQGAAISLLSAAPPAGLPASIEILPLTALPEVALWADYLALDLPRSRLEMFDLATLARATVLDVLVETSLVCGGLAECGVCAVRAGKNTLLTCKDGPVFEGRRFIV